MYYRHRSYVYCSPVSDLTGEEEDTVTSHIPDGANSVGVYLVQSDTDAAIRWYVENLGAKETMRLTGPDGQGIMHAELDFQGTLVMMSDANPQWGTAPPGELSTFTLTLYVPDCDAVFEQCVAAGATELQPMMDQFWGDRGGTIRDPFGHVWMIMTHKEDVSPDEIRSRFAAMMSDAGGG